ncbi:uncharacterized protein LOC134750777 [Cydia strobilella]|uniref:uncharacterized protein LOC134750777 n=1 Tax=Cydia strobilella TaxID=1100964 RepID=UPI003006967F
MRARAEENWPGPQEVRKWREEAHDVLYHKWTERLEIPGASRDLVTAVRPVLKKWVERKHGTPSFHLTQLLTGHGCFGWYLCERVTYYFITERAVITHRSPKYVSYINFTATRKNRRRSPMYYVDIHYNSLVPFDDNLQVDFWFYQFLSNEYRRSFVEMHFRWCSLIHDDPFFGAAMKQGKLNEPCPYPPGDYHMYNMSIPTAAIPPGFPFTKGRIFANLTHNGNDVFGGYIDMELKEKRVKN